MRRKNVPIGLVEIAVEPYLTASDLPPGWIDAARVGRPHSNARPAPENAEAVRAALGEIARDTPVAFSFDEDSGTFLVGSTDEETLDAVVGRLKTEYGQFVRFGAPQIAWRETIATAAIGEFGRVKMKVEPAFDRVTPFDRAGAADRLRPEWLAAVERGVAEALKAGPVIGSPVLDVKVTLDDFASHETDWSPDAFARAAAMAVREAVAKGRPFVLEPCVAISISAPAGFRDAIVADIRSRRGRVSSQGTEQVEAVVPFANLFGYRDQLRSITRGAGSFAVLGFDSYQPVPPKIDPDDGPAVAKIA